MLSTPDSKSRRLAKNKPESSSPPDTRLTTADLSDRQLLFIEEYMVDYNATRAATRAGYTDEYDSAAVQGHRLLSNAKIAIIIKERQKQKLEQLGVTSDRVLAELAKLGFSNMADYMNVDGDGLPHLDFSNLTRDQAAALTEVTVEEYWDEGAPAPMKEGDKKQAFGRPVKKVKFKLSDKRSALVDLGKHLRLFDEVDRGGLTNDMIFMKEMGRIFAEHALKEKQANAITV